MTREEILAMVPGDELDKLVAMKIMGFEQSRMRDGMVRVGPLASYPKRYSTDISAAWEVVDKLKIAVIPQSIGAPDDMKYLAKIEDYPMVHQSFAATAPLAICRCALLAVLEATP